MKQRNNLEDLGMEGTIILDFTLKAEWGGLD